MSAVISSLLLLAALPTRAFTGDPDASAKVRFSEASWTKITARTALALDLKGSAPGICRLFIPVTCASLKNNEIDIF